jgi:hypothetical protein
MKADNPVKHFAIAFVLAVLVYVIAYSGIEHRRNRKGPWEITFTTGPSHQPALIVNQAWLGITNVHLLFSGQAIPSNLDRTITFRDPRPTPFDAPFGQCIFMDLTFLPGTLTFRMFGHEIELLPRVMILDHEEHRWRSGEVLDLGQAEPKLKGN